MTQLQFTLDMEDLKEMVMSSNMEAVVRSSIVLILNEYMEKERDAYMQADHYERSGERQDYRNGYYERAYTLNIGKVELRVPRTRSGEFSPTIFEKYARMDQAFMISMLEMVIHGVSTRKVTHIVEQLCGERVSKSFVSSLTEKLDPIVNAWADRPLNTVYYPYVFADAMYTKVREHHKVVSKAIYIMTAIREDGRREILGLHVDHSESFESWFTCFEKLKSRGLQSPKLIISDAHQGLQKAIQRAFIGTSWQRCNVHFKRNILDRAPKKEAHEFRRMVKRIFEAVTIEDTRQFKQECMEKFADQPKYDKALQLLDEGFDDTIQYMTEPEHIRIHIRSTNSLERLNQEVRRRERVIRVFPNTQSAFRLVGAVLMHYQETIYDKRQSLTK
ncbi:IS256 family transposase [Geomicrobium sp. JCM 19039]|uniref:IS256 family transposase n=1 Tax=Geomicrobium sp. JCM 19039 TaxID=1460636 RepID=UPI00045F4DCF|nr:IS256 family transposase [Geomicrobium sp. JCM 19039]GAK14752.1 mobile element protein [Geomicrobium sp. JCM 19039]